MSCIMSKNSILQTKINQEKSARARTLQKLMKCVGDDWDPRFLMLLSSHIVLSELDLIHDSERETKFKYHNLNRICIKLNGMIIIHTASFIRSN